MNLDINLIRHGSDAEVRLNGFINAANAPEVERILTDVATRFDSVTLDMEKLEYVSSAGLRTFKQAYAILRRKGGVLYAKNASKAVIEVFEITGFLRLFTFL